MDDPSATFHHHPTRPPNNAETHPRGRGRPGSKAGLQRAPRAAGSEPRSVAPGGRRGDSSPWSLQRNRGSQGEREGGADTLGSEARQAGQAAPALTGARLQEAQEVVVGRKGWAAGAVLQLLRERSIGGIHFSQLTPPLLELCLLRHRRRRQQRACRLLRHRVGLLALGGRGIAWRTYCLALGARPWLRGSLQVVARSHAVVCVVLMSPG